MAGIDQGAATPGLRSGYPRRLVDFPVERRRGRHSHLGRGHDDRLREEKRSGFQNSGAVIVGRAAMAVASVRRNLRARFRSGVRLLAFGDASIQGSCFPMLKKMRNRRERQQRDSQTNQSICVFGSGHCGGLYCRGSCLSSARAVVPRHFRAQRDSLRASSAEMRRMIAGPE